MRDEVTMPRAPRRPRPVRVGELRAYAVRGPHPEDRTWYWRIVVHRDGEQRTLATGWHDRREVERRVARMVADDAWDEDVAGPLVVDTVDELMRAWVAHQAEQVELRELRGRPAGIAPSSYTAYLAAGRRLSAAMGDIAVDRIDSALLEGERDRMLRQFSPRTVRSTFKALRAAWAWARARRMVPDRVLDRVTVHVDSDRHAYNHHTPTAADVARVAAAMDGWSRLAVTLLWTTGARRGAIARLTWGDVAEDAGLLWLENKGARRALPIVPQLAAALDRPDDARDGDRVLGVAESTVASALNRYIARGCRDAGVQRFTCHGLRRLASTVLIGAGVSPRDYEAIMGHTYEQGLRTYAQARDTGVRQGVALLGRAPSEGDVIEGPWTAREDG